MHVEIDGDVWRIVEFQHVKPGKGGAFVRTKLKSIELGRRRRPDLPRRREVHAHPHRVKSVQYLYDAGPEVVFMDEETYEQIHLPRRSRGGLASCARRAPCRCSPSTAAGGAQLPSSVELAVTETEPGVRGDTGLRRDQAGDPRDGRCRPGAAFVNAGDRIRGDPREKRYISRA